MRRTLLALLATALCAVTALTSVSASASALVPDGGAHGDYGDYLALGDSVVFGYRPPAVTPPSEYLNAANFKGYPDDVAAFTGLRLTNASCPGETTASMMTRGAQSNGCENSVGSPDGYRTHFPLHANYSGTQLDFAVQQLLTQPRTRLVTLGIGANDVFVCEETTPDHCTGADFQATLGQIAQNLSAILGELRDRAHYHGELMLVSYYSLDYRDANDVAVSKAINTTLASVAAKYDAKIADGFTAFGLASLPARGDTCAAGLLIKLPTGGCDVHPTARGHAVLAAAVGLALAR